MAFPLETGSIFNFCSEHNIIDEFKNSPWIGQALHCSLSWPKRVGDKAESDRYKQLWLNAKETITSYHASVRSIHRKVQESLSLTISYNLSASLNPFKGKSLFFFSPFGSQYQRTHFHIVSGRHHHKWLLIQLMTQWEHVRDHSAEAKLKLCFWKDHGQL